jgi:hypothetical protein
MWTEVSPSVPHFLQVGLLLNFITCRRLLRVLCPARRPVTTLDCVHLKDSNRALVARPGPEINFRVCPWVLPGPRHFTKCWLSALLVYILPRVEWCPYQDSLIKYSLYTIQNVHATIHHLWHISTPRCFGTEVPSSGSYYNKGVQSNMTISVLLFLSWRLKS